MEETESEEGEESEVEQEEKKHGETSTAIDSTKGLEAAEISSERPSFKTNKIAKDGQKKRRLKNKIVIYIAK